MSVYANLRRWGGCLLLAVCDSDVLGKTLRQGKIVFHVSEEFYKGSLVTIDEALALIENASIVNMVGQEIVGEAIKRGVIHPDAVLEIDGVLHAQIVKLL